MKCPLNNFAECDTDCAWYLKEPQCCAVKRLDRLCSNENLIALKAIQRDIESINKTLNISHNL